MAIHNYSFAISVSYNIYIYIYSSKFKQTERGVIVSPQAAHFGA